MAKNIFQDITPNELKAKGVVALANNPNVSATYGVGGLSPTQLKKWFDNLGELLAERINTIHAMFNSGIQSYIGIDNLGDNIESLEDLTASFLNGSFATILLAYHSAADVGDTTKLATLQAIINEKARLISELTEAFNNYKTLIKSSEGAAEVGVSDSYNGSDKKLSDVIADIANGTLAAKLSFMCYGVATSTKDTTLNKTLKEFADFVADALQGDINSGLLEKIENRYTKTEVDNLLAYKVDKATYTTEQNTQDSRLTSLETRTSAVEGNIGDMANVTPIAADISLALKSLNQDIDSLQLGVIPRVIRGVIEDEEPDTLDDTLIAALNAAVLEATGRSTPNNSDAVNVLDNAMPDKGRIYTYYYWSSDVIGSELDGWYLAAYYTAPSITEIPSYTFNILESSWSEEEADTDGLYYITITSDQHGMGTDNSLYVDLRRFVSDDKYASESLFYVTTDGNIIIYSDEKFTGKVIVRVGKAYYTANETIVASMDMDNVTGLAAALAEKVTASGGEVGSTVATFSDIDGTASNVASGETTSKLWGKVKNFFSRLKSLAFKSSISNSDVADDAAIEYSKLSGVAAEDHTHDDRYYTESEMDSKLSGKASTSHTHSQYASTSHTHDEYVEADGGEIGSTVVTFDDVTTTRTNITSGDSAKNLFGRIKQWLSALGTLAFKSKTAAGDYTSGSITNSDISSSAAIDQSKISGLTTALAGKASTSHTHSQYALTIADGWSGSTTTTYLQYNASWGKGDYDDASSSADFETKKTYGTDCTPTTYGIGAENYVGVTMEGDEESEYYDEDKVACGSWGSKTSITTNFGSLSWNASTGVLTVNVWSYFEGGYYDNFTEDVCVIVNFKKVTSSRSNDGTVTFTVGGTTMKLTIAIVDGAIQTTLTEE